MTVPAWYSAVMPVSEPGVVTGWPSTEVITSPAPSPSDCAAVPHRTPSTRAPVLAGAIWPALLNGWLTGHAALAVAAGEGAGA